MKINDFINKTTDVFQSPIFIQYIEDSLDILSQSNKIGIRKITSNEAYYYKGDFYGLLNKIGLDKSIHYVILRINGYKNTTEYKGEGGSIRIFDPADLIGLVNIFNAESR